MNDERDRNGRAGSAGRFRRMQLEQAFMTMSINQILNNPLEGETPSARLKQVGLMTVIGALNGEPLTLSRLVDITGLTRSGVGECMGPLVERGILVEEMGKNSMGRGMARQFHLSPVFIDTLGLMMGDPIRHGN
ncbi:hypothetical protein QO004_004835 [Rhizobium mesoamericanum]|uniref:hypothetical protein n=1 Tax=Rhizobium mesoamericanum TaxID=1079800 RepID=UPI0027876FF3|nr:hypothetical protein [Rhizobium mesoamericanum]MDQ0563026.1 hypothetical protein [Rhizobium mesoamericanum]